MRRTFPVLALVMVSCGMNSSKVEDPDDLQAVESGKEDNFRSLGAREYSAQAEARVVLEAAMDGASDEARLDKARELVSAKLLQIGWFLNLYVADKEPEDTNRSYGGFHAMARNASVKALKIEAKDRLTYAFNFAATIAAEDNFLQIVPGTVQSDGAKLVELKATGKERWHVEVDVLREAELGAHEGLVFVQTTDAHLRAYDAQTGKAAWAFPFGGESGPCGSRPVVADGIAYQTGGVEAYVSAGARARDRVWAIDAATGQERWRHRTETAACADHPVVVTADGVLVTLDGDHKTYGLDRATGRRRWVQTITRTTDLERDYAVRGLVQAGDVIVGMTSLALVAFDPASGRVAWELPGRYRHQVPVLAAASGVLYFQGSPDARTAARIPMIATTIITSISVKPLVRPVGISQKFIIPPLPFEYALNAIE